VIQWNKRDLPGAVPVATLDRYLNRRRAQTFEAAALTGDGVFLTLRAICKAVMARL
jgi:mutual gliding-motility protein MglA